MFFCIQELKISTVVDCMKVKIVDIEKRIQELKISTVVDLIPKISVPFQMGIQELKISTVVDNIVASAVAQNAKYSRIKNFYCCRFLDKFSNSISN